jgi:hypothetical protein
MEQADMHKLKFATSPRLLPPGLPSFRLLSVGLLCLGLLWSASVARAQTVDETVAIIFYAADGSSSPNVKINQVGPCRFRLDMFSEPIYEVDFSLMTKATITKTSPKTEVLLTGTSSLFASVGKTKEPLRQMPIVQNANTGEKIMDAVAVLRKNYCPGQ